MAEDFFGTNLDFEDFDKLLKNEVLDIEPVPIEVFVTDKHYLGLPPLSDIQVEIGRHITQIFKPETLVQLYGEQKGLDWYNKYTVNEVICQLGKGSGKDHVSRVSLAYISYLLHCLRDPLGYFGKAAGVYIDLVNLAVNAKQAQQVFFDPLKNLLLASPWANDVGFEPRVQEIFWFSRPVRMFSGHSEAEGWEGYEVLIVVLDEISAFKTDVELKGQLRNKGSASEIYDMARASITSRFPSVGKVVLLSFPRFKGDFIQQRYKSVIDDLIEHGGVPLDSHFGNRGGYREAQSWALKAATWEVNPTRHKEEFENEFRRDPIMARARFMCEPPEMVDAYFRDPESVRAAFKFKEAPIDDEGRFREWFLGSDAHPRYIHVDLGLKRDRAAISMVHSPGFKQIKTLGGIENLPIVEMDYIQSWKAEDNSEIPFAAIRSTITELTKRFTVVSVTFDQWNSADMIQSLRALNINADLHTVAKKDYDTLSTAIYDGRLRGYWNEILVEEELLKLKLINNTKVDHPTTGSKDLADSVAGATFMCISNLSSDFEIDIEILDEVNYDIFDSDESSVENHILGSNRQGYVEKRDIPNEIADWLNII